MRIRVPHLARAHPEARTEIPPDGVHVGDTGAQAITIDVVAIIAAGADRRALQSAMDAFRTEMQRIAERQAHTEGRLDERTNASTG